MKTGLFTQGTMIRNIRSGKYPEIKCGGVVISARCDLANRKIPWFHCLTFMELKDFIYEIAYERVVKEFASEFDGKLKNKCRDWRMSYDVISGFDIEEKEQTIRGIATNHPKDQSCKSLLKRIEEIKDLESANTRTARRDVLKNHDLWKKIKRYVEELYEGKYPKYILIPLEDDPQSHIIVDLQDIISIPSNLIDDINEFKIDSRCIENDTILKELNEFFWLDNDDYVVVDGCVDSPWIEYLLQAFAFSFMRIGVDYPRENCTEYIDELVGA